MKKRKISDTTKKILVENFLLGLKWKRTINLPDSLTSEQKRARIENFLERAFFFNPGIHVTCWFHHNGVLEVHLGKSSKPMAMDGVIFHDNLVMNILNNSVSIARSNNPEAIKQAVNETLNLLQNSDKQVFLGSKAEALSAAALSVFSEDEINQRVAFRVLLPFNLGIPKKVLDSYEFLYLSEGMLRSTCCGVDFRKDLNLDFRDPTAPPLEIKIVFFNNRKHSLLYPIPLGLQAELLSAPSEVIDELTQDDITRVHLYNQARTIEDMKKLRDKPIPDEICSFPTVYDWYDFTYDRNNTDWLAFL